MSMSMEDQLSDLDSRVYDVESKTEKLEIIVDGLKCDLVERYDLEQQKFDIVEMCNERFEKVEESVDELRKLIDELKSRIP